MKEKIIKDMAAAQHITQDISGNTVYDPHSPMNVQNAEGQILLGFEPGTYISQSSLILTQGMN